jgi:hypothetical protein
MSEQERQQFGLETGEVLVLAIDEIFASVNDTRLYPVLHDDIVIVLSIKETMPQFSHNVCIVLHPQHGLLSFGFQYQVHRTAWQGVFVNK